MHECPECSEYCDCDGEDHDQPAPRDCRHDCETEGDDDGDAAWWLEREQANDYPDDAQNGW